MHSTLHNVKSSRALQYVNLALSGLLLMAVGCGPSSNKWTDMRQPVFKASGVVLLDGKALEGAEVVFHAPEIGLTATGRTDATGTFKLTTYEEGDGFIEGTHSVSISKRVWIEKPTRYDSQEEPQKALFPQELLAVKFTKHETSQLQATIEKRGKNSFEFVVSSK